MALSHGHIQVVSYKAVRKKYKCKYKYKCKVVLLEGQIQVVSYEAVGKV